MLKVEDLKALIPDLSDDQAAKIAEASRNDEANVINANRREWWSNLDADIKDITGAAKPDGMKTHEHHKQWLKELHAKSQRAEELTTEVQGLQSRIETLQKGGSGDEQLKAEIERLKGQIQTKETELTNVRTGFDQERDTFKKQLEQERIANMTAAAIADIESAMTEAGVAFDPKIPEAIRKETLKNRRSAFLSGSNLKFDGDDVTNRRIILTDENGAPIANPADSYRPMTPGAAFLAKIDDLIDKGNTQPGGGTKPGGTGGTGGGLNLSAAKTQVDADAAIRQYIMTDLAIARTDTEKFDAKFQELRTEHKVAELPMREGAAQ